MLFYKLKFNSNDVNLISVLNLLKKKPHKKNFPLLAAKTILLEINCMFI